MLIIDMSWCLSHFTMGNLFYNRWRCEQSNQNTSWSHFPSVDVAPWKRLCTFFYRIYPKENIVYSLPASCRYFMRKTDEISRTLRLKPHCIQSSRVLVQIHVTSSRHPGRNQGHGVRYWCSDAVTLSSTMHTGGFELGSSALTSSTLK
jgi:hypothetical protein